MSFQRKTAIRLLSGLHFLLMVGIFLASWLVFYRVPNGVGDYFVHNRTIFVAYTLAFFYLSRTYSCYKIGLMRIRDLLMNQFLANVISWAITYVFLIVMAQRYVSPLAALGTIAVQTLFSLLWTTLVNRLYFSTIVKTKTAVIYRDGSDLDKLGDIPFFEYKWDVLRYIRCRSLKESDVASEPAEDDPEGENDHPAEVDPRAVDGNDIHAVLESIRDFETIFVAGVNASLRNGIVKYCVETGKDCFFVPHIGDVIVAGSRHIRSYSVPVCGTERKQLTFEFVIAKRVFDILVSLAALVVLAIPMAITAILIKCYDHGPVFYKQVRLTVNGKPFRILKFRSMCPDAEKDGVARLSTGEKDDRITPVGRVIRAIRFDELPQLFNILKGDMSIVGPRPERPEIAEQYEKELPAFRLRLQVKAGLTGYAQVYGKYNTAPEDKLKMDLMYINNIGFAEDLRLIFATVAILFKKDSTRGIEAGKTTAQGRK